MHKETKYLSEEQARPVYRKVESGGTIDINTLKQEIEQERELSKLDDTSGDINPYRELIVINAEKVETVLSQKEQWLILSNVVNYMQYNKYPKNFHNLNISAVNKLVECIAALCHACVFRPSEQCSLFQDDQFEGSHA